MSSVDTPLSLVLSPMFVMPRSCETQKLWDSKAVRLTICETQKPIDSEAVRLRSRETQKLWDSKALKLRSHQIHDSCPLWLQRSPRRWSAGTQKWVVSQGYGSSTLAWSHRGSQGTGSPPCTGASACGTLAPPLSTPPCCPSLHQHSNTMHPTVFNNLFRNLRKAIREPLHVKCNLYNNTLAGIRYLGQENVFRTINAYLNRVFITVHF